MILETKQLTKRFGGLTAVDSVDFGVESGELRSIIGPNGAGKTTLFNLLTGVFTPTEGRIIFQGDNITELTPEQRVRAGMARSFQVTNIFQELSVRRNVRIALQRSEGYSWNFWSQVSELTDLEERTEAVIRRVGIETDPASKASTMPYGEKRRLEIAISVAQNPSILLLDEPAAGLSAEETSELIDLVRELNEEYTIILIEHDIDLVMELSDQITVLTEGAVIAEGSAEEIRSHSGVQDAYLGGKV